MFFLLYLLSSTVKVEKQLKLDRHWQQYRNEKEALAQKKELTLMQARRDYAPALEVQELFTLQWIVI